VSAPVPYRTTIRHSRTERAHHAFRYRHVMWLVDLDDIPPPRRLARWLPRFVASDHFGDPHAPIRTNVERYLAGNDIDLDGGRILMLTNPRSLGYAFNPLTVFWCYAANGTLRTIVAEVHNTFGERHCYLVEPGADGRRDVEKELYVSPFFAVDGTYDMRFGEPGDEIRIAITLRRGPQSEPVFTATLDGRRGRTPRSFALAALRHPCSSMRVTALIHWQALQLWLRRIPIAPRPIAPRQEHVS
jgi:hypothetical protein